VGSDYKKKDLIIKKGTIIQPSHILAFKTLGINNIKVKKKPNILFFSTGNEISNNKRHNIFGLWSIDLLDVLEDDLKNNNFRKVEVWADKIGVKIIDIKTENYDPFFNINTKEDLKIAQNILKKNKND
jgi:hypothetical protein